MPGTRCSVAECKNSMQKTKNANLRIKYHPFPKDENMRNLWRSACNRSEDWNPQVGYICSQHFQPEDYERDLKAELLNIPSKRRLKPTAFPVTFTGDPHLENETDSPEIPCSSLTTSSPVAPKIRSRSHKSIQTDINFSIDHYNDAQRRISELESQLRNCEEIIKSLRSENQTLQNKLTASISISNITSSKNSRMLEAAKKALTQNQFDLLTKNKKKVQWTADEISKAFTLRYYSKRAYLYLRSTLNYPLPGISTLERWTSKIKLRQGILTDILFMMKIAKDDMTEMEKCVLLEFGEMKVKSVYEYDKQQNEVIGPYSYMQLAMARGLFGRWKQPVYIDFETKMTKNTLNKIIEALENAGYNVVGCVSNCSGKNMSLWKELDISIEKTYSQDPTTEAKTYFFADAPHLLKLLRNWLLETGFVLEDGTLINKEPLKALVDATDTEIDYCCDLTIEHIEQEVKIPRRSFTLAEEIFSNKIGTALVDYQPGEDKELATNTGKFIQAISTWYDIMNSHNSMESCRSKKPYGIDVDYQISELNKVYDIVSTMRCIGKNFLQLFQKGILISITSLKALYNDMKTKHCNVSYILTQRLNLNCLENLFDQVRTRDNGLQENPSPLAALHSVRMIVFGKRLDTSETSGNMENSSPDEFIVCKVLEDATLPINEGTETPMNFEETLNDDVTSASLVSASNNGKTSRTKENGLLYLAGWIARKFNDKYSHLGNSSNNKNENINNYVLPSWIKHLSFDGSIQPTQQWLVNVHLMDKEFVAYHRSGTFATGKEATRTLCLRILKKYGTKIPFDLIRCFVKERTLIRRKYRNAKLRKKYQRDGEQCGG